MCDAERIGAAVERRAARRQGRAARWQVGDHLVEQLRHQSPARSPRRARRRSPRRSPAPPAPASAAAAGAAAGRSAARCAASASPKRLDAGDRLGDQPVGARPRRSARGARASRRRSAPRSAPAPWRRRARGSRGSRRGPDIRGISMSTTTRSNRLAVEALQRLDPVGADGDLGVERAQHLRRDHLVGRIVLGEQHAQPGEVRRTAAASGGRPAGGATPAGKRSTASTPPPGRLPSATSPPSRSASAADDARGRAARPSGAAAPPTRGPPAASTPGPSSTTRKTMPPSRSRADADRRTVAAAAELHRVADEVVEHPRQRDRIDAQRRRQRRPRPRREAPARALAAPAWRRRICAGTARARTSSAPAASPAGPRRAAASTSRPAIAPPRRSARAARAHPTPRPVGVEQADRRRARPAAPRGCRARSIASSRAPSAAGATGGRLARSRDGSKAVMSFLATAVHVDGQTRADCRNLGLNHGAAFSVRYIEALAKCKTQSMRARSLRRRAVRGCWCGAAPCRSASRRCRRRNPGSAASRARRRARPGTAPRSRAISGSLADAGAVDQHHVDRLAASSAATKTTRSDRSAAW